MIDHLSIQRESVIVDSLAHPLAGWIREVLTGTDTYKVTPSRLIIIDDEENILQALQANLKVERVFHTGDQHISAHLRRVLPDKVTIHEITKRTSKKLFGSNKLSRVFAVAQTPRAPELADLAVLKNDIVVLENLGISGNVGAVIRTAVAFGVGGVVLLDSEVDIYDRRLIRASRGQIFSLPVVKAKMDDFLTFCKRRDWQLLATAPSASRSVYDLVNLRGQLVIIFGNEKEGCSPALLEAARFQIKIPTNPLTESLNVSAAAAITLFQRIESNL